MSGGIYPAVDHVRNASVRNDPSGHTLRNQLDSINELPDGVPVVWILGLEQKVPMVMMMVVSLRLTSRHPPEEERD